MGTRFLLQLSAAIAQIVIAERRVAALRREKAALAVQAGATAASVSALSRTIAIALGPIGIAAAAVTALVSIGFALKSAAQDADLLDAEIKSLLMSTDQLADARYTDAIARQTDKIEEARQAWEDARRARETYTAPFDAPPGLADAERRGLEQDIEATRKAYAQEAATLQSLQQRLKEVRAEREAQRKSLDGTASQVQGVTKALDSHVGAWEAWQKEIERVAKAVESAEQSLRSQIDRLREERLELTGGTKAVMEYRRAKLLAAGATEAQLAAHDALVDTLVEEERALQDAKDAIELYSQALIEASQNAVGAIMSGLGFADVAREAKSAEVGVDGLARSLASAISAADGASLGEAIGTSLRAYGTEAIAESLQSSFEQALEQLGVDTDNVKIAGYAFALGQVVGGQVGAGIGAAVGQAVGGPIGSVIGSLVGGLFDSKPKRDRFNFGDLETLLGRKPSVDADFFRSWFGDVAFGFTGLDDQAVAQIVHGLQEFDRALATAIQHSGAGDAVAAALANFAHLSDKEGLSIDQMMQGRFDAALSAMDWFTQELVKRGDTLEDQMQRLADVFAIETELFLGRGLGLTGAGFDTGSPPPVGGMPPTWPPVDLLPPIDGFIEPLAAELAVFGEVLEGVADASEVTNAALRHTLAVVEDLQRPSESLAETFARLQEVTDALDFGIALVGTAFEGSREDLIRFGDELSRVFGDDLESLVGGLDKIFETFFTADELAQAAADGARNIATELLERIDIDVTDDLLTLEGFRALWDDLFLALGPEQQALLIEAGGAIADLIAAEEALAAARENSADELGELMRRIYDDTLSTIAPAYAEYNRLAQAQADLMRAAQALGASEGQLAHIRTLHTAQLEQMAARLMDSIRSNFDVLTGALNQAESAVSSSAGGIASAVTGSLDAIQQWLDKSLLSDVSPLLPDERLAEAQAQFDAAISAGAVSRLPGLADALLKEASGYYRTSTAEYDESWQAVRDAMEGVDRVSDAPTGAQASAIQAANEATANNTYEQIVAATSIVQELGVLSRIMGELPSEIAAQSDLPIDALAAVLAEGEDISDLGAWLDQLVGDADDQLDYLLDHEALLDSQLDTLLRLERIAEGDSRLPESYTTTISSISEHTGETNSRLEQLAALQAQNNEQNKQQMQQQAQQIAALQDMIRMMREEQSRPREAGRIG